MSALRYLLAFASIVVIVLLLFANPSEAQARGSDAVLADQVTGVLLRKGVYSTGRRTRPVPQLQCVGGAAAGKWEPEEVACTKSFTDGRDVYWKCEADMPDLYKFGTTDVNCEGYNFPHDDYILQGSCALRYTLEYTAKGLAQQQQQQQYQSSYARPNPNVYSSYQRPVAQPVHMYGAGADTSSSFWTALILGPLVIFALLTWCGHLITLPFSWARDRLFGVQVPPATYDTTSTYRPIYPTTYAQPTPPPSSSSSSSGFWTGLLGGGALGYLYNRWLRPSVAPPPVYQQPLGFSQSSPGIHTAAPPSSSSSSAHHHSPSPPRERHTASWATESRR